VRRNERTFGLWTAGGKGKTSRQTPAEIAHPATRPGPTRRRSRVLAGRLLTVGGEWAVLQQGMRAEDRSAWRYHWLGEQVASFVCEPHAAVCADAPEVVLNLVAAESSDARRAITEPCSTFPRDAALPSARLRHAGLDARPRPLRLRTAARTERRTR
jgi:hypothetical protein